MDEFDYEYRVDTDVITSVEVSGGQSDPDNPVTCAVCDRRQHLYHQQCYYPDGDSQLVWVKCTPPMNLVSAPFRSGCWAEARRKAPSPPTSWI